MHGREIIDRRAAALRVATVMQLDRHELRQQKPAIRLWRLGKKILERWRADLPLPLELIANPVDDPHHCGRHRP